MIEKLIEKLLVYGMYNLGLKADNYLFFRNYLMHRFNCERKVELSEEEIDIVRAMDVPDALIQELEEYLNQGHLQENETVDNVASEVLGMLTPLPGRVIINFNSIYRSQPLEACNYLYRLQIKNNYVKKTAINQNIFWSAEFPGDNKYLEITINRSKPEILNKEIEKEYYAEQDKYPQCLICQENIGFYGNLKRESRVNLRYVPLVLDKEQWFMQYSPYGYFDHHMLAIKKEHEAITIDRKTFSQLMAFVDKFPFYFIGSNAELPIVGGPILHHEHFQGGKHLLPILFAHDRYKYDVHRFDCEISYLEWFNSCFLIKGKNRKAIVDAANFIFKKWRTYNDPEIDLLSKTTEQHSTITPIMKKVDRDYYLYLVLRNNRKDETHPEGIFHAKEERHHIKQEAIGLIECSGLFILPGRLKFELNNVVEILSDPEIDLTEFYKNHPEMKIHEPMINKLIKQHGRKLSYQEATDKVQEEVNYVCKDILEDTAIFKNDEKGQEHLKLFVDYLML